MVNPHRHVLLVGLVATSLLGPRIGIGQIYKSIDEQGRTVYSDQPEPETSFPQGTPTNGLSNAPTTAGSMPQGVAPSTGRGADGAAGVVVARRPPPAPVPEAPGQVFVAKPPYRPTIGNTVASIDLAGRDRRFDFGGSVPFVNPLTGAVDVATVNAWNENTGRGEVWTSNAIGPAGVNVRVYKRGGYTAVGYFAGDGVVEGRLRTQLNSYPIPARRRYTWELEVRFGGATLADGWVQTARGEAPATIWQVKAPGLPPPIVMAVDTDPRDSARLMLHFDIRTQSRQPAKRLGQIGGVDPGVDTRVVVDGFLDEREPSAGGQGYWRITVGGNPVVQYRGATLQKEAYQPYSWSIGMYLYNNTHPLSFSRFTYWRQARLLAW
jgi:hypothetical protein